MNRIDRLFGILTTLQSKKYVTAEKLAAKFDISVRTLYRDIKALGELGIPISFEQHKGYFIVNGYFLPPVSFTNEEANAMLLMEAIVSGFADNSIKKHYSTGLNKVKAVLKSSQKEKIEMLTNNIKMQVPQCFQYDFEYLSIIQNSITSKHILEIEYKNNKEEINCRKVEPIGLVFYALAWHLIAWCNRRLDYRDFKVARIIQLKNTDQPFTQAHHITLNDYMKSLPVAY
jgi:predicted DNA-binding transcriptional regulator YafY